MLREPAPPAGAGGAAPRGCGSAGEEAGTAAASPPRRAGDGFPNPMRDLRDFQEFHRWLDRVKGLEADPWVNFMLLTGEVGEVAAVLKRVRWRAAALGQAAGGPDGEALAQALAEHRPLLGEELADCLAFLLKLANNAGVDLQAAYLAKMRRNLDREWPHPAPPGVRDEPGPAPAAAGHQA